MRTLQYTLFLLFSLIITESTFAAKQNNTYGTLSGVHYVDNYDGDTITVTIPGMHPLIGEKILVRIRGIDTPEIKGQCSAEEVKALKAKKELRSLLEGAEKITLRKVARGKYFRIIADVEADGNDIGKILVQKELAVSGYYGGKKKYDWCSEPAGFSIDTLLYYGKKMFKLLD